MKQNIVVLLGLLFVLTSASVVDLTLSGLFPSGNSPAQIENCQIQEQDQCTKCKLGFALNQG